MTLRVGVVGALRGAVLARHAQRAGLRVVAVCERDARRRDEAARTFAAAAYARLEPFLDHAMDGVIVANDFDQHAPVAIRALERGLGVLSETAACATVAEGVALIEAVERSGGIYMFAENYPYTPFSREMRRRYAAGDVGELRYAEAEYLHLPADLPSLMADRRHWRARIPATYYSTHSLAPVAAITGTRPVQVSGFVVPTTSGDEALARAKRGRGWAALLIVRVDTGALIRALHGFLAGGQWSWVRVHGDHGLMENMREGDTGRLRVVREGLTDGPPVEELYLPTVEGFAPDTPPIGDGVGETLMLRDFAEALRTGTPPRQDVYFGVELSITGIQAMRSSLAGGAPIAIPDLRHADLRRQHASDSWVPVLPDL